MKWEYEFGKQIAKNYPVAFRCHLPGMTALLVGTIGTLLLAPILVPAVKKVGKSIAKTTVKGGILVYEGSKELVSEAKAELAAAKSES
jgi:hypothetical protein